MTQPEDTIDYRASGVDVEAGRRMVEDIGAAVESTHGPEVLGSLGGFAGLYRLSGYRDPVLVSGADGVGTKVEVARAAGHYDTIGIDLVAMCVNDVICHGARPLFFLDYIAVDRLDPAVAAEVVAGVAAGCRQAGCALIGGETAEMPGVYRPGRFDLAGFALGAVERNAVIDGRSLRAGMALVGLASSGFHANGFSLLRRLVPGLDDPDASEEVPGTTGAVGDTGDGGLRAVRDLALRPTRIYAPIISTILAEAPPAGIAHITGGGWFENIPRLLGRSRGALSLAVDRRAVPLPEAYEIVRGAPVEERELYATFNMGLGMVLAVEPDTVEVVRSICAEDGVAAWKIGEVTEKGSGAAAGTGDLIVEGFDPS